MTGQDKPADPGAISGSSTILAFSTTFESSFAFNEYNEYEHNVTDGFKAFSKI
jgi:hypothetical protein